MMKTSRKFVWEAQTNIVTRSSAWTQHHSHCGAVDATLLALRCSGRNTTRTAVQRTQHYKHICVVDTSTLHSKENK